MHPHPLPPAACIANPKTHAEINEHMSPHVDRNAATSQHTRIINDCNKCEHISVLNSSDRQFGFPKRRESGRSTMCITDVPKRDR